MDQKKVCGGCMGHLGAFPIRLTNHHRSFSLVIYSPQAFYPF